MSETTPNYLLEEEEEGAGFDYKVFLIKLLMYWPWIAGCLIVALIGAFFYVKTLTPLYTVSSSVLIQNESKQQNTGANLAELGFITASTQSFDNELEILQSRTLVKKVVNALDLYIKYSVSGNFRDTELYKSSPVKVWVTPEEAEKMGYAEAIMYFEGNALKKITVIHNEEEWSQNVSKLPMVFPTPAGVFTFMANDSTHTALPEVKEIRASVFSPTATAAGYRSHLTITPNNRSTTIAQLTITDSQIARATDFLSKLVSVYNEEGNNAKNEVATKTARFIDERIHLINAELGTTENELASFKQKAGVVDITADASQAASEQSSYERAYAENEVQLTLIKHLKKHILSEANQNEVIPANIGLSNTDLNAVVERYNEMLIERKRLLRTSHEENPAVQSLNASIEVMRNSVQAAIQAAEKGLIINRQALEAQARKFAGKISDAPVQEKQFLSISRQQGIQANLYLMLLQKREENNITLASTANNARVIDEPLAGGQVFPQPAQIYMMAGVGGLALPIGIIFLIGLMHFKIETRSDIERLTRLPIVGDIPMSPTPEKNSIVISENRNELMDEVFRAVRTNLQYMLHNGQKVILFTSTTPHEGKSFCAGNIATSLAYMGKKVVIVGLDIRKTGLNRTFGISRTKQGITSYLADPVHTDLLELCQPSEFSENLHILLGGKIPPNPTELVARKALEEAIDILKKNYDYVILDTAPIGMVTDTQLVARVADLSVYICRSGITNKSEFQLINELKTNNRLPNPCILLNGIDMSKRNTGSYYGYGKYGKYGKYGYGKKYGYGYGYGYGAEENN